MHQPTETVKKVLSTSKTHLVGINAVGEHLNVQKAAVYSAIRRGELTQPIKFGNRVSRWLQSEVTAIVNARIAGKSIDEIKALVLQLEAQRLNACEVNA